MEHEDSRLSKKFGPGAEIWPPGVWNFFVKIGTFRRSFRNFRRNFRKIYNINLQIRKIHKILRSFDAEIEKIR